MTTRTTAGGPKIYTIPLPEQFACQEVYTSLILGSIYAAELKVGEALARSNFTTTDPAEADFFYVPVHLYCLRLQFVENPENMTAAGAASMPCPHTLKSHYFWTDRLGPSAAEAYSPHEQQREHWLPGADIDIVLHCVDVFCHLASSA